jgi:hypothetical protein
MDGDIWNIFYASWIGNRKVPDDEMNLDLTLKEWQEMNPDTFFRVSDCIYSDF